MPRRADWGRPRLFLLFTAEADCLAQNEAIDDEARRRKVRLLRLSVREGGHPMGGIEAEALVDLRVEIQLHHRSTIASRERRSRSPCSSPDWRQTGCSFPRTVTGSAKYPCSTNVSCPWMFHRALSMARAWLVSRTGAYTPGQLRDRRSPSRRLCAVRLRLEAGPGREDDASLSKSVEEILDTRSPAPSNRQLCTGPDTQPVRKRRSVSGALGLGFIKRICDGANPTVP